MKLKIDLFKNNLNQIKKNGMLIKPADIFDVVYKINSGFVRQYVISQEGTEFSLRLYGPGDIFPLESVFSDKDKSEYYYEALTDVAARKIAKEKFAAFLEQNPEYYKKYLKDFTFLISMLSKRMGCLVFCNAYARIVATYLYLAEDFGTKLGNQVIIHHKFTHKDIGSLSGLARETSSSAISKLENKKIVKHTANEIIISDITKLEAEFASHKEKKREEKAAVI